MMNRLSNKKGITLIELLVGMVICAIVIAAIYRVFIAQSRAYVVQDQVVEIQQNIRTAMEMMVRDVRMAGFDFDNLDSPIRITDYKPNPPYLISGNSITIWFENYVQGNPLEIHAVRYSLNGSNLERELTINGVAQPAEVVLENVTGFTLTCGLDGRIGFEETQDGVVNEWVNCGTIDNNRDKVIAVRISLSTRPEQADPQDDRFTNISPRTLNSMVALRNLGLRKF